jgi:hypothetical protein
MPTRCSTRKNPPPEADERREVRVLPVNADKEFVVHSPDPASLDFACHLVPPGLKELGEQADQTALVLHEPLEIAFQLFGLLIRHGRQRLRYKAHEST